jgi:hypothetical protein
MELGFKKLKTNLNYRAADQGSTERGIMKNNFIEKTTVLSPDEVRRKNTNNNHSAIKKQVGSYNTNDKLIFDPKKYVNIKLIKILKEMEIIYERLNEYFKYILFY